MHLVINLTWWNNKQCSEEIPSLKTFKCPQSGLSRVESWEAQGKQWGKWDREKSRMNALTKKLVWRTARVPSCLGVGPSEEHWNKLQGCFTWGQANSSTFLLTPIMHRWRWSSETLLCSVWQHHTTELNLMEGVSSLNGGEKLAGREGKQMQGLWLGSRSLRS